MRILVLTTTPREPDNQLLWEGLRRFAEVEIVPVTKERQRRLGKLLATLDFSRYDRVIFDLLFRYLSRHVRRLQSVAGLTIYEEDACQEFIETSRWRGKFSAFYRRLPHARVILTGFHHHLRFRELGVDARFLPKGYDSAKIYRENRERDIALGFIGRLGSSAYRQRRELLEKAQRDFGLAALRTLPGEEYRQTLNRIRTFVSADIGLGEYMAKNFEAMACGCLLLAYRQGNGEEEALGLADGENVLLYRDDEELAARIETLRGDDTLVARLASQGEKLARESFDYDRLADRLYRHLHEEMATPPLSAGALKRMWRRFFG